MNSFVTSLKRYDYLKQVAFRVVRLIWYHLEHPSAILWNYLEVEFW